MKRFNLHFRFQQEKPDGSWRPQIIFSGPLIRLSHTVKQIGTHDRGMILAGGDGVTNGKPQIDKTGYLGMLTNSERNMKTFKTLFDKN